MRLSCPNCGAQYEVPAEVIPENGRDVQCSNCGHTWFQVHPDHDAEMSADLGASAPDEGWTPEKPLIEDPAAHAPQDDIGAVDAAIDGDEVQPPEMAFEAPEEPTGEDTHSDSIESAVHSMVSDLDAPAPQGDAAPDAPPKDHDALDRLKAAPRAQHEPHSAEEDEGRFPVSPSPRPRRQIDPDVIDVLREEAEHEAKLRAQQNADGDLETQPDLGLDAAVSAPTTDPRADEARDRMRRMRGPALDHDADDTDTQDAETSLHAARRDLLPDIEEINSTLRATDERSPEDTPVIARSTRRRRRVGFRLGFGFTMLAASFVLLAYVYNKEIIAAWPAGEAYVTAFVDKVNALRLWLDAQMTTAMLWLDDKAAAAGGNVGDDISQ
ncbi:MAG: zinc-ribbon domain-containing protein [Pseudopelagicola sp.]|nr:zinc-ribbon domain-containing protein [Pseudopelagicola sp.]